MTTRVRVTGLAELDRALGELPKATGKNVLRRVARGALKPVEETAKQLVPVVEGILRDSIVTGTQLSRREARDANREGRSSVEVHTGTVSRNGVPREFGTSRSAATPFMRPAWDQNKDGVLRHVETELAKEIEKARARLARKAARAAKG
jgi:HK97 gp10 family phage protein